MRRLATLITLATCLALLGALPSPVLALDSWSLAGDWSDTSNPNLPWTYGLTESTVTTWAHDFDVNVANWLGGGLSAWYWSTAGGIPGFGMPTDATPQVWGVDWPNYRVGMHTDNTNHDWGCGAKWTAPRLIAVDLSGGLWMPRNFGRVNAVSLVVNGIVVINNVNVPYFDTATPPVAYDSTRPWTLDEAVVAGGRSVNDLKGISLTTGQSLWLVVVPVAGAADFVGMDFTIQEVPPPAVVSNPFPLPAAGTYNDVQTVTINCGTPDATIRYTTDGSDPDTGSTTYTAPLTIDRSLTLKAKAWKAGMTESGISSAGYVILVSNPVLTPRGAPFLDSTSVTMSCATPGATIRYTTDGSDPDVGSTVYSAAVPVSANVTIKAKAWKGPADPSAIVTEVYTLTSGTGNWDLATDWTDGVTPSAAIGREWAWSYGHKPGQTDPLAYLSINLFSQWGSDLFGWSNTGAYGDPNGIPPQFGKKYAEGGNPTMDWPVGKVFGHSDAAGNPTIFRWTAPRAIAVDASAACWFGSTVYYPADYRPQEFAIVKHSVTGKEVLYGPTILDWVQQYTTGDPAVDYNTDPGWQYDHRTTASLSNISVEPGDTLDYVAFAVGIGGAVGVDYSVTERAGSERVAAPVFSRKAGTYPVPQSVTISCATAGAAIRYTTDGNDPTGTSTQYSAALAISSNTTLKAKAFKSGLLDSALTSADYSILGYRAYSLAGDWSAANNPNGVWTYGCTEPDRTVWAFDLPASGNWIGSGSPGWGGIPGMTKMINPNPWVVDWPVGRVGLHADNTGSDWACGAKFTAPWPMTVGLSGGFWMPRYIGRVNGINLVVRGAQLLGGAGVPQSPYTSANTYPLSQAMSDNGVDPSNLVGISLNEGDTLWLAISVVAGGGDFTAMDFFVSVSAETAPAPVFTPGPGAYVDSVAVAMSCAAPGTTIRYTTDGSDPTSGTVYTTPITITSATTFKAKASGPNMTPSAVATASYTLLPDQTIATIKAAANGLTVAAGKVFVTATFGTDEFYVEEPNRTFGIQVRKAAHGLAVGQPVDVVGLIQTDPATNERYIDASTAIPVTLAGGVTPLGVNGRSLGGSAYGLQVGVPGSSGLNNIGLLVKAWGRVTPIGATQFSIDDGSGPILVEVPSGAPTSAIYAAVTGISSLDTGGGRKIRVYDPAMIVTVQAAP